MSAQIQYSYLPSTKEDLQQRARQTQRLYGLEMTEFPQSISTNLAGPDDFPALARLEAAATAHEGFSQLAFGSTRFDESAISVRAQQMAHVPTEPEDDAWTVKAFRRSGGGGGKEEILGFASWSCVRVRETWQKVGIYAITEEMRKERLKDGEGEGKVERGEGNRRVADDVFVPADMYMAKACGGRDYLKLRTLAVSPQHQRRGVGSKLLLEGLRRADSESMQCVLGASPEGKTLYEKHGFVVFEHMEIDLSGYEGGEGMGVMQHYIMHRPARTLSKGSPGRV